MSRKYYIPKDEDSLSSWATNLASKAVVPANSAGMGWTAPEETAIVNAAEDISTAVAAKDAARQVWMGVNAAQDQLIADSIAVIRPLVAEGKAKPTATEAIQKELGVWGIEQDFDPGTYVADLRSAQPQGGGMLLVKFSKAGGHLSAANLYLRKTGETNWTMAATMLRSPFIHHVTLAAPGVPESYEARVRGVMGNAEIGSPSPAQTVLVD